MIEYDKKKYLGENKILQSQIAEEKTPNGESIIRIKLENNQWEKLVPKILLDKIITDKPLDATAFRNVRVAIICERLMDILSEYDTKISDLDYIFAVIKASVEESFRTAEELKWQTSEKGLLDINRVLKSQKEGVDN